MNNIYRTAEKAHPGLRKEMRTVRSLIPFPRTVCEYMFMHIHTFGKTVRQDQQ